MLCCCGMCGCLLGLDEKDQDSVKLNRHLLFLEMTSRAELIFLTDPSFYIVARSPVWSPPESNPSSLVNDINRVGGCEFKSCALLLFQLSEAETRTKPSTSLIPRPKRALEELIESNDRIAHSRPPINIVDRDSAISVRSAVAVASLIMRVLRMSAPPTVVRGTGSLARVAGAWIAVVNQ
jgi:hypothetical protein